MYTKAKSKFKEEKVYLNTKSAGKGKSSGSQVVKGKIDGKRVVRVDPRMKKEKKAEKRTKRKGGVKGKRMQK